MYDPAGANPYGSDGKSVTLSEASADVPGIPLPNSPLANASNVGTVWENSTGSIAAYYPSSGIEWMVLRGSIDMSPGPPAPQIINGFPALVLPGVADTKTPRPSVVEIDLGNNRMAELVGFTAVENLVDVAHSLPVKAST
ncbi:MAG: hypothetical protein QOG85_1011 [Gaiellaceae bacterium]|nr:hypothetical protein [Gaiellaceae bacterium]